MLTFLGRFGIKASTIRKWLIEPSSALYDAPVRRRARMLSILLIFFILLGFANLFVDVFFHSFQPRDSIATIDLRLDVVFFGLTLLAYQQSRTKRYVIGIALVVGGIAPISFINFFFVPQDPFNFVLVVLVMLFCSLLIPPRAIVATFAFSIVSVIVLQLLLSATALSVSEMISFIVVLVGIGSLSLVSNNFHQQELNQIEQQRRSLAQSQAQYRDLLEVERRGREIGQIFTAAGLVLSESLDLDRVLNTLLDYLQRLIPYDTANVCLRESETLFKIYAVRGYEPWSDPNVTRSNSFDTRESVLMRRLVETKQPMLIADTRAEPDWQVLPGAEHVQNFLCVPLISGGEVIGCYAIDKAQPNFFTPEHVGLAEGFANRAAIAIQNARLYEQVRQSQEHIAASEALYHSLAESAEDIIFIIDAFDTLRYINTAGGRALGKPPQELIGKPRSALFPAAIANAQKLNIQKVFATHDQVQSESSLLTPNGERWFSNLLVPLKDQVGHVYGVLGISRDLTDRKRAEQEIEKRSHQLEALRQISLDLTAELNLDTLLRSIGEHALQLMEATTCSCYLLREERQELQMVVLVGSQRTELSGYTRKRGEGLIGKVWERGVPIVVDDYKKWREARPVYREEDSRAVMGVPIRWGDKFFGVLTLTAHLPHTFQQTDVELAGLFADQAAIAIQNARLFEQAQQELVERRAAEAEIKKLNEVLERRVAERTAELEKANRTLRASEERYRLIAETIDEAFWTADVDSDETFYISSAYQRIWGRSLENLNQDPRVLLQAIHPDDLTRVVADLERQKFGKPFEHEFRIVRPDGQVRWIWERGYPIRSDEGVVMRYVGVAQDITERKHAQERLQASLTEKEILLREVHHRVKNNLQIIASMLNLQASNLQDQQILAIFRSSQKRIDSIALVHEKLYRSEDLQRIDIADYLHELALGLFGVSDVGSKDIRLNVNAKGIFFGLDTAIPLGLIANELITNALKYAFLKPRALADGQPNAISISLEPAELDDYILTIADNGSGLPPSVDFRKTESLGLQLVTLLVKQLDGTIDLDTHQGSCFCIKFKEAKYNPRN